MAKNKKHKSKGDSEAQQKATVASNAPSESSAVVAEPAPEPTVQPADNGGDGTAAAVADLSLEQLRAEVLSQRQQLAVKDAEISQLKSQLQQAGKGAMPLPDTKYPDVDSLRARLEALRKEQEEADSARDKAWSQLKKVVGEISKLASPDYVTSLVQKSQSSDGKSNDLDGVPDMAE